MLHVGDMLGERVFASGRGRGGVAAGVPGDRTVVIDATFSRAVSFTE
jgi:hypothetical protein